MERKLPEGDADYEGPRRLPDAIAYKLAPKIRHALDHPTRRGILRTLSRRPGTCQSPGEILMLFPGASLSTIAYHARVLCECDGVVMTIAHGDRGTLTHQFASDPDADPQYQLVLEATEELDTLPT